MISHAVTKGLNPDAPMKDSGKRCCSIPSNSCRAWRQVLTTSCRNPSGCSARRSRLAARTTGLLALIETPEAMEALVLRSQDQDDAKRRAQRCITAVQEALRLAVARGWLA